MRRLSKSASAVLALIAAGALSACVPGTTETTAGPDPVVSSQLWADLTTLAADDMEGRGAGTPGGERARNYIVSRFEQIGIAAP
ncbi:MAG TPA: peptidase M28, partial [Brevundimonas sp.]|nr:peptidase M28 [Brevundimonas sp.]